MPTVTPARSASSTWRPSNASASWRAVRTGVRAAARQPARARRPSRTIRPMSHSGRPCFGPAADGDGVVHALAAQRSAGATEPAHHAMRLRSAAAGWPRARRTPGPRSAPRPAGWGLPAASRLRPSPPGRPDQSGGPGQCPQGQGDKAQPGVHPGERGGEGVPLQTQATEGKRARKRRSRNGGGGRDFHPHRDKDWTGAVRVSLPPPSDIRRPAPTSPRQ